MKNIKLYEKFIDDKKWILGINENIFKKIETLVKGKSEKGKVMQEFLTKNAIQPKGNLYNIHYLGGANPGKEEMSNPIDYLQYTPGLAKIVLLQNSEVLVELTDEKAKTLQVPDTISWLSIMAKDDIVNNFTIGLKPGSSVKKSDYEFDLTKDVPVLTMKNSQYSIPQQKWNPIDDSEIIIDEDISEVPQEDLVSFKNPMKMITLQQWVDELNETGWVSKNKDYFTNTMKFSTN
jgi:hypothetical protein